jgi:hypothetical protein
MGGQHVRRHPVQSFESQVRVDVQSPSPSIPCSSCQRLVPESATTVLYSHDGKHIAEQRVCASCVDAARTELAEQDLPHGMVKPALAGLVGTLVAAAAWAGVAIAFDREIGYLAVLLGALTGLGVRWGARPSRSHRLQVLAAGLSVLGLFAAKYFIVAMVIANQFDVSPFDSHIATYFFGNFGDFLSLYDLLWTVLAVGAAYKMPAPAAVHISA